jgi:hypothetical protein
VIGPQVFRFEYCYLLKGEINPTGGFLPSILSNTPWDSRIHTAPNGLQDIAAVVVDIAVIDPKSNVLVTGTQLAALNGGSGNPPVLVDYSAGMTPGQLLTQWRAALDTNTTGLPRPALSGIRLYERRFYLSPPTL